MKQILTACYDLLSHVRTMVVFAMAIVLFSSCNKTDYLDVAASARPSLSAKISFVNARPVSQGINFYTYTTLVNTTPVLMNKATAYMPAQFGLVQINMTAAGSTSYLASSVFGGSADFTASGGPNGPVAGYFHTVFALKSKLSNFLADSIMLFYDDLNLPPAGNAKIRFVHIAPGSGAVDVFFKGSNIFTNVAYGAAGGAILSGTGLNAYSIGPFKTIPVGTGNFVIRTASANGTDIKLNSTEWDNFTFADGKIYTIFLNGNVNSVLGATALLHN